MSITISNMNMPIGCQKCKFFKKHLFGNGLDYSYSCILGAKDFPMPWIRQMDERARDCPLIETKKKKTMTREEAIKQLNKLKSFHNGSYGEAINFAIESIKVDMAYDLAYEKVESYCDDCISRQAVLEYIEGEEAELGHSSENELVRRDINELPSVIPAQKWIPVSERLPEKDGEYLLFGKIDEDEENYIFIGEYDSCAEQFGIWQEQYDRETLGCLGSEFFDYSSVIAWMPLPKEYKESEDKNEMSVSNKSNS